MTLNFNPAFTKALVDLKEYKQVQDLNTLFLLVYYFNMIVLQEKDKYEAVVKSISAKINNLNDNLSEISDKLEELTDQLSNHRMNDENQSNSRVIRVREAIKYVQDDIKNMDLNIGLVNANIWMKRLEKMKFITTNRSKKKRVQSLKSNENDLFEDIT